MTGGTTISHLAVHSGHHPDIFRALSGLGVNLYDFRLALPPAKNPHSRSTRSGQPQSPHRPWSNRSLSYSAMGNCSSLQLASTLPSSQKRRSSSSIFGIRRSCSRRKRPNHYTNPKDVSHPMVISSYVKRWRRRSVYGRTRPPVTTPGTASNPDRRLGTLRSHRLRLRSCAGTRRPFSYWIRIFALALHFPAKAHPITSTGVT